MGCIFSFLIWNFRLCAQEKCWWPPLSVYSGVSHVNIHWVNFLFVPSEITLTNDTFMFLIKILKDILAL